MTEHDWQALNVYPNPTRDIVRVEESTFPVLQELRLYNMQGLLLRKENDREISLRDYEPGIYFLEALSSRGRLRTKVIRE